MENIMSDSEKHIQDSEPTRNDSIKDLLLLGFSVLTFIVGVIVHMQLKSGLDSENGLECAASVLVSGLEAGLRTLRFLKISFLRKLPNVESSNEFRKNSKVFS